MYGIILEQKIIIGGLLVMITGYQLNESTAQQESFDVAQILWLCSPVIEHCNHMEKMCLDLRMCMLHVGYVKNLVQQEIKNVWILQYQLDKSHTQMAKDIVSRKIIAGKKGVRDGCSIISYFARELTKNRNSLLSEGKVMCSIFFSQAGLLLRQCCKKYDNIQSQENEVSFEDVHEFCHVQDDFNLLYEKINHLKSSLPQLLQQTFACIHNISCLYVEWKEICDDCCKDEENIVLSQNILSLSEQDEDGQVIFEQLVDWLK